MKWVSSICLSVVLAAGCQQNPPSRLNAPPQGSSTRRSSLQEPFQKMSNNAALADMSIADMHFAGTSTHLNGTGEVRMQQLAELLKTYGGELRYNTQLSDEKLVQERLNRIEDYLATAGVDMNKVSVRSGMPASEGMGAAEAIKAQQAPTAGSGNGSAAPSNLMPKLPGGQK